MKKQALLSLLLLPLIACVSFRNDWKELDLKAFKISVPKSWIYKPQQGEDSFIGDIIISKTHSLSFDFSSRGYANSLLPTEQEYLSEKPWTRECYFCKMGVTYTSAFNVKNAKKEAMERLGNTDSTLVKVEAYPEPEKETLRLPTSDEKLKHPDAKYIVALTYKDSTVYIPVKIPATIKAHHIKIDSTADYIIKTVWPVMAGKGMTGIYVKSRTSSLNFQLSGLNLSAEEQADALKAFKTLIIIPDKRKR